jgi:hypothetical protein
MFCAVLPSEPHVDGRFSSSNAAFLDLSPERSMMDTCSASDRKRLICSRAVQETEADASSSFPATQTQPVPRAQADSGTPRCSNQLSMLRFISLVLILGLLTGVVSCGGWFVGVGVLLFAGGLSALVRGLGRPGATQGLGSVLVVFLGFCVALIGLVAGGNRNLAEAILGWVESIPTENIMIGSFILGIVLAALSSCRPQR